MSVIKGRREILQDPKRLMAILQSVDSKLYDTVVVLREKFLSARLTCQVALDQCEQVQRNAWKLAKLGWYASNALSHRFLSNAHEHTDQDLHMALRERYSTRLDNIQDSLMAANPKRATILKQAFQAHHSEHYFLSVITFLAQADGIATEKTGHNFFTRKQTTSKSKALEIANQDAGQSVMQALLLPDATTFSRTEATALPLFATLKERKRNCTALNRHLVMHGETVEYGTEDFSLQALSFLCFINDLLPSVANGDQPEYSPRLGEASEKSGASAENRQHDNRLVKRHEKQTILGKSGNIVAKEVL